jgi:ribosome-associated protein
MVRLILEAAAGKKAEDPVALDLRKVASFTDCFVICHGAQSRQTQAICDAILETLRDKGIRPGHVEGYDRGDWILIDLSDVIVHIFTREKREFYNLERLWGDAPALERARTETRRKRGTSAAREG